MLKQEEAVGNYCADPKCFPKVTGYVREQMVLLIEQLHVVKDYKIETLHLAVSIADRYLVHLSVVTNEPPCLVTLAVISLLMAAKLE